MAIDKVLSPISFTTQIGSAPFRKDLASNLDMLQAQAKPYKKRKLIRSFHYKQIYINQHPSPYSKVLPSQPQ